MSVVSCGVSCWACVASGMGGGCFGYFGVLDVFASGVVWCWAFGVACAKEPSGFHERKFRVLRGISSVQNDPPTT